MKASRLLIAVSALLALPSAAGAQPGSTAPGAPMPTPPAGGVENYEPYSPGAALAWSLVTTGAGYAMAAASDDNDGLALAAAAAILVGPNAGDIYAGDAGRALVHTGIRAGGLTMVMIGALQSFDDCFAEEDTCNSDGEVLLVAGAGLFVVDSIYSIVTAPSTAREQNEKARRRLMLTPTPIVSPDRPTGYGLSLSGEF